MRVVTGQFLLSWLQKLERLSRTPEVFFQEFVVSQQYLNTATNSSYATGSGGVW